MNIIRSDIEGLLLIEPRVFSDARGFFLESWNERRYRESGITAAFVQDNLSFSRRGTLRGLHFQNPTAQAKLVSVLQGEVFDVAVDMRRSSPHFGQWEGVLLSADNKRQLWIPPGFAHGFLVTSDSAEFLYKTTDYYHPEFERCLLWSDPAVGVQWPVAAPPLLAAKDQAGLPLQSAATFA